MAGFDKYRKYLCRHWEVSHLGEMATYQFPNGYAISIDNTVYPYESGRPNPWEVKLLVPENGDIVEYALAENFKKFEVKDRIRKLFPFEDRWLKKFFTIPFSFENEDFVWKLTSEDVEIILEEAIHIREPFAYKITRTLELMKNLLKKLMKKKEKSYSYPEN